MSIRFLSIRAFVPTACVLSVLTLAVRPSFSQTQSTPPQAQTGANPAPAVPAPAAPAPASKEPDYPDPRSITIGVFGLSNLSYAGPNIQGGVIASQSNAYESLYGNGQPYQIIPQFEFSVPVTRTGTLYIEGQRYHGDGTQTLTRASFLFSYSFNPGDVITPTYHYITSRIYLDDLLFPHKFPVSRLRFKSIWGLRYVSITQTVISPTEDAAAGATGSSFELGTNYVILPEFGAAMEYALAPHVLFRVDGEGFAIPHHSDIGEEAQPRCPSVRRTWKSLRESECCTSRLAPKKEEYESGTFVTPFLGLRWHFLIRAVRIL